MPTSPGGPRRHRRLAVTALLALATAGALAAGATAAGAAPSGTSRSVAIQDPADVSDPRVDLRAGSVAVGADGRFLTVSARLQQPTSPTGEHWWRGLSLPRAGITWGLNTDPAGRMWDYVVQLRGDPDLGPYGYVAARGTRDHDEVRCRTAGSFDGTTYRVRFPVSCIGSPERLRFTAYVQLYDEAGTDILGADYAPGWDVLSGWLALR